MPHWLSNSSPSYLVGFASIWSLQSKTMRDLIASLKLIEQLFFCFRLLNIWYIRGSKLAVKPLEVACLWGPHGPRCWPSRSIGLPYQLDGQSLTLDLRGVDCGSDCSWRSHVLSLDQWHPQIENRRDMLGTLQHPEKLCKIVVSSLSHPFSPVEALETDPLTRLCRGSFHPAINQYHHSKRKSIGLS